jgi:hypothetical protein
MNLLVGLPESTVGRKQEFYYVDIVPTWFSILTCHLGDER